MVQLCNIIFVHTKALFCVRLVVSNYCCSDVFPRLCSQNIAQAGLYFSVKIEDGKQSNLRKKLGIYAVLSKSTTVLLSQVENSFHLAILSFAASIDKNVH